MKLHYMSIQEMQNMSATEFMAEIKIQKKHRKELSKLMENRLTEPEKILEYLAWKWLLKNHLKAPGN